jgi:hypothetical protein
MVNIWFVEVESADVVDGVLVARGSGMSAGIGEVSEVRVVDAALVSTGSCSGTAVAVLVGVKVHSVGGIETLGIIAACIVPLIVASKQAVARNLLKYVSIFIMNPLKKGRPIGRP